MDASIKLMRSQGYNATTVDDICSEAGVTKGGFFHYFSSKQDIAQAALERFREGMTSDYAQAPFRQLADPLDRVLGRLDYAIRSAVESHLTKGCLIGMFAQELSSTHPELREACQQAFLRIAKDLETDLVKARAVHSPKFDFDPKHLSLLYVSVIQGSLMMAKAAGNNDVLRQNLEQFRNQVQNLFSRRANTKTPVQSRN